ncbi:hypothetical protein FA15DRAFT_656761 [Coprinopsis marcescibilis]|uniref:C2H2-type domain-containing protein n=1 Tax=Coprinopsis marcescibilis TaxID=230819 RepID=A0A5C3KS32_COPMA|nr:hypothetical protein FA15DRAFT_656761 [Coprinopsis marcescibilis]
MPKAARKRKTLKAQLPCLFPQCCHIFESESGRTKHARSKHPNLDGHCLAAHQQTSTPPCIPRLEQHDSLEEHCDDFEDFGGLGDDNRGAPQTFIKRHLHPWLTGQQYDENGNPILEGKAPPPRPQKENQWAPFEDDLQFEIADFLYRQEEMSQANVNHLLYLWGRTLMKHGATMGPYDNYQHIFSTIDSIEHGDAPWECLKVKVNEDLDEAAPFWKTKEYDIWFWEPDLVLKNLLANPDFHGQFDYAPYIEVDAEDKRQYSDCMSGDYSWKHADTIYNEDNTTEGATYVPIILGSDKTTVTVATGDIEYYPLYLSIGNVHNAVRRAHRNAVIPIAFLAIPKDGYYRRVIYDFAAYIADYPEQVLLAGIVQGWCPKCTAPANNLDGGGGGLQTNALVDALLEGAEEGGFDYDELRDSYGIDGSIVTVHQPFTRDFPQADIHEMLSSDLLHQAKASQIMDQIDRRLAAVPPFSGLRRFKQGRQFKQWTGDDSKALMKVYLPAIRDLLPAKAVECLSAFLDFCYLVRRNDFNCDTLLSINQALQRFHLQHEVFRTPGVWDEGFSLPRQHSLVHYLQNIRNFGAPNGLCSSITESCHITAVKQPWRRSNHYKALGQMLLINQRLDKLHAAQSVVPVITIKRPGEDEVRDEQNEAQGGWIDEHVLADVQLTCTPDCRYNSIADLESRLQLPRFGVLLQDFIDQNIGDSSLGNVSDDEERLDALSGVTNLATFRSAAATFYAPSDTCGIRVMRREWIRSTLSWRGLGPRYDCVYVVEDDQKHGFEGMNVVRVKLFLSFDFEGTTYSCAMVEWFKKVGTKPDSQTGMWVVEPDTTSSQGAHQDTTIIHIDSILHAAHLIPVFGSTDLPATFNHSWSLDTFSAYFVNKYIDHHANEITF